MSAIRWLSVGLLALAVVAGAAWWLQRQSAAQLRDEIALLRQDNGRLASLRAENAKLVAAQLPAAELERLRADRAAVVQFRAEIGKLKSEIDDRERALEITVSRKTASPERDPEPITRVLAAAKWKNAGRATPLATLETVLWAGMNHDVDAMVGSLAFDPAATREAQALFDASAVALRQKYGSPMRMVAALMAEEMPVGDARVIEEKSLDPNPAFTSVNATLNAELKDKDGDTSWARFELVKINGSWLLKVPAKAVEHFGGESPAGSTK